MRRPSTEEAGRAAAEEQRGSEPRGLPAEEAAKAVGGLTADEAGAVAADEAGGVAADESGGVAADEAADDARGPTAN